MLNAILFIYLAKTIKNVTEHAILNHFILMTNLKYRILFKIILCYTFNLSIEYIKKKMFCSTSISF